MSCYGCGLTFGGFKKEHGCKNCGFAFCSKCLPKKIAVPKKNNEHHHVCLKCYNILTGKIKPKEDDPARYSPPENYKKRMAALQERESHGTTKSDVKHKGPTAGKGQYKGMSQADFEIQQRLEKLKEKSPKEAANVTNKEIDDRLAKLKGMDPARYNITNKPTYQAPDKRTQQEQMNDLLNEIGEEVQLDSRLPDPTTEIAARLARLKDQGTENKQPENPSENNLNKASLRDSQTFSQNIKESNNSANTKNTASDQKKPDNTDGDEISVEEIGKILNEAAGELEKDAQRALQGLEEDKEIMKRLQDVKKRRKESVQDVNKDEEPGQSDSENEESDEVVADKIIKRFVEESKLDEAAGREGIDTESTKSKGSKSSLKSDKSKDSEEWVDEDELPYCCICTEDATVRCFGCDRDLYCQKCFSDGHKELGLTDHAFIKYTPPKGLT